MYVCMYIYICIYRRPHRIATLILRPHTLILRPHTLILRPHTLILRPHTLILRPHTPHIPHTAIGFSRRPLLKLVYEALRLVYAALRLNV